MKYNALTFSDLSVRACLSSSETAGAREFHAMIEGTDPFLNAARQYASVESALRRIHDEVLPSGSVMVLKRYFVSDAVNHAEFLSDAREQPVAISVVQQPPLGGMKVALWAYFVEGARMIPHRENAIVMEHSSYRHLFDMQMHSHGLYEVDQTADIFSRYISTLREQGCTIAGNTIRTWIFVQGVDTHYAGMVRVRKAAFDREGLTEHTHYIASTGIEGKYIHPETTVLVDAYAVDGIRPEQVTYLKGASHLSPTHKYGVTFERATAVDYGDRRHIFVSGTASIDNEGRIVYPGDVAAQTKRTLENIGVLLDEGGAVMNDVAYMIVYLRDTADYAVVSECLERTCPDIPKILLWAPVCRPGWLVEIECVAVKKAVNEAFAPF